MKNAPFAYQSQTGKWSIFIMNVENVSLKTESQSYKSLTLIPQHFDLTLFIST